MFKLACEYSDRWTFYHCQQNGTTVWKKWEMTECIASEGNMKLKYLLCKALRYALVFLFSGSIAPPRQLLKKLFINRTISNVLYALVSGGCHSSRVHQS